MTDDPTPNTTRPRIYVASLADYNAGRHHGVWVDATQEPSAISRSIREMLTRSGIDGAEEWAIHDHEGFAPLRIGESSSIGFVSEAAQGIRAWGEAFAVWLTIDPDGPAFSTTYLGEFDPFVAAPEEPTPAVVVSGPSGRTYVFAAGAVTNARHEGDPSTHQVRSVQSAG